MIIKTEKPEIYETLKEKFGVDWDGGVVITYGDTVYHSPKYTLPIEKIIHEQTHIEQQTAMGAKEWWDKYLEDIPFRLSQEVEAYKREAYFIRRTIKDREKVFRYIHRICLDLSSFIYGNIVTYSQAKELLK